MTKKKLISKWEKELDKWKVSFNENALFHTHEWKEKSKHYAFIISVMLNDIKKLPD